LLLWVQVLLPLLLLLLVVVVVVVVVVSVAVAARRAVRTEIPMGAPKWEAMEVRVKHREGVRARGRLWRMSSC